MKQLAEKESGGNELWSCHQFDESHSEKASAPSDQLESTLVDKLIVLIITKTSINLVY
jgi:hypothetical protein